jgi:hypothetical protein
MRLADIPVPIRERSIKLRYTLAGTPPALLGPPGSLPRWQALASVHVEIVSKPR